MFNSFAIIGPTASGKSGIGFQLIKEGFSVVNFDSCQLYQKLPILKAIPDNLNEHYLYQIFKHKDRKSVLDWALLCELNVQEIFTNHRKPLLIGGTGFYLKSLCEGIVNLPIINQELEDEVNELSNEKVIELILKYDPLSLKFKDQRRLRRSLKIFLQTNKTISEYNERLFFNVGEIKIIALLPDMLQIKQNIKIRLERDFDHMLFEVEELQKYDDLFFYQSIIGIQEINSFLKGSISKEECKDLIFFRTCQYAKRQSTYIRNCLKIEKTFFNDKDLVKYIENSCY